MSPILTITFSPCIDKSTTIPALIPEKKLRCTAPLLEPGGGGINVARAIKKLNGVATALYPSGGHMGILFNELMARENIPSRIIPSENETRENIILWETSTNNQYRLGIPGAGLHQEEWEQLLIATEEAEHISFIVASGSLPPGVPPGIFNRLGAIAKNKSAKLIVDTSGEALQHAAKNKVFLLKPNLAELASLAGKTFIEREQLVETARQVIEAGSCEVLVVSLGAEGALLVTLDSAVTFSPPPVEKKSTVGAGDSMVAGIVLSLSLGKSLEEAARYGVACGTAATMNPGTELCRLEDANRLYDQCKVNVL